MKDIHICKAIGKFEVFIEMIERQNAQPQNSCQ
jgi:hypothetical protein